MTLCRSIAICATAVVLTFWTTLEGSFTYDDRAAVVQNSDVIGPTDLGRIFAHDFWGTPLTARRSHQSYRPLSILSLRMDHALSGTADGELPSAWVVHAHNVALHAAASALVCLLAARVFGGDGEQALLAGLLFAAHPVHSDVVAQAVGRAELLSACGVLVGLECWFGARLQGSNADAGAPTPGPTVLRALLAVVAALAAMLCKEQGITLLGVCVAGELALAVDDAAHPWRRRAGACWVAAPLVLVVGGALAVGGRLWVLGFDPPIYDCNQNPASCEEAWHARALSYAYLASRHAWFLVAPTAEQCYDWSFGAVPPVRTLWDTRNALSACAAALLVALAALSQRAASARARFTLRFGLALGLISFFPASNALFPVGFTLAERVLYVPSVGGVLLFAWALHRVFARRARRCAVALALLAVCASRAAQRAADFRTNATLFEADFNTAECGARNAKVHFNLGQALQVRGDALGAAGGDGSAAHARACTLYRSAIELSERRRRVYLIRPGVTHDSGYAEPKLNLATLLLSSDVAGDACALERGGAGARLREAERVLYAVASNDPSHGTVHLNLAIALAMQGRTADAVRSLTSSSDGGAFRCPSDLDQPGAACAAAAEALSTRAFYEIQLERWSAAKRDATTAVALSEGLGRTHASALYHLALWWDTSPQRCTSRARALYERAARAAPEAIGGQLAAQKLAQLPRAVHDGECAADVEEIGDVGAAVDATRCAAVNLDATRWLPLRYTLADGVEREDRFDFTLRAIASAEGLERVMLAFAAERALPQQLVSLLRGSVHRERARLVGSEGCAARLGTASIP